MTLLASLVLLAVSCTRIPTLPRSRVILVGTVPRPSHEGLPYSFITFQPGEPGFDHYAEATTDSSGAYSVSLVEGTYRVGIQPPYDSGFLTLNRTVTVSIRNNREDFSFQGFRVTGTVLDPTGALLDSGWVNAQIPEQGSATSALLHGAYSLLLPAGHYSFFASSRNYWSGFPPGRWDSVPVAADTILDLRLSGIPVSGIVLGPDGLPLQDVRVEARAVNSYRSAGFETGADGSYRLYVPGNSYRFYFNPPYPFYIIPRIVGPVTIGSPTTIDGDLSGIQWSGAIRRSDTFAPVPGLIVLVDMLDDPDRRGAAIDSDAQGEFRFILEPNRRYDLYAYDRAIGKEVARVSGISATVDTTFEILIPPPPGP